MKPAFAFTSLMFSFPLAAIAGNPPQITVDRTGVTVHTTDALQITYGDGFVKLGWPPAATPPAPVPPTPAPVPVAPIRFLSLRLVCHASSATSRWCRCWETDATPAQKTLAASRSVATTLAAARLDAGWCPFDASVSVIASWQTYCEAHGITLPAVVLITVNGAGNGVMSYSDVLPDSESAIVALVQQARRSK